jgi:hypothetical protein
VTLQLIGAGFGRTGTLSLKAALEQLGYGPCHHMLEVMGKPEHVALWRDAAEGRSVDWAEVYAGYAATVDWPGCTFWRELVELHPDAKVILTLRDRDAWYESARSTIYQALNGVLPAEAPDWLADQLAMARKLILERTFSGRFEDRTHAMDVFDAHNQSVKESIAANRLLVFEVADGWGPLCQFLDRPVPDGDFPHLNEGAAFRARMAGMQS